MFNGDCQVFIIVYYMNMIKLPVKRQSARYQRERYKYMMAKISYMIKLTRKEARGGVYKNKYFSMRMWKVFFLLNGEKSGTMILGI